jgi:hypothetical protein
MAAQWKDAAERKGGVEGAKPPDAHAFLQHVATFAVAEKADRDLYRRIVLSFSWRRQMPRLALTLGLEDDMEGNSRFSSFLPRSSLKPNTEMADQLVAFSLKMFSRPNYLSSMNTIV